MARKSTFKFFGSFTLKAKAKRAEKKHHAFIRKSKLNGSTRYIVMKKRGK